MLWSNEQSLRGWVFAKFIQCDHTSDPLMSPAPSCDAVGMFIDDGFLAGPQAEMLCGVHHLRTHMPTLGFEFFKMGVIPPFPGMQSIDVAGFVMMEPVLPGANALH